MPLKKKYPNVSAKTLYPNTWYWDVVVWYHISKKNLVTHSKTIIPFTAFITIFELSWITMQFTDSVRRPKTNFPLNVLSVTPGQTLFLLPSSQSTNCLESLSDSLLVKNGPKNNGIFCQIFSPLSQRGKKWCYTSE